MPDKDIKTHLQFDASNLSSEELKQVSYSKVKEWYKMGKLFWYSETMGAEPPRVQENYLTVTAENLY